MSALPRQGWLANSPLRHKLFLGVWLGSVSLGFGNQIQLVGASWAMTEMTHSPKMVALVTFSLNAPLLLFSMAFGALSDLYDKRKVMLAAYAIMGTGAAALALLGQTGNLQPWLLLVFTFVMGTGFALNMPSWQASVRELVPVDELSSAVSMNAVGNNVTRTAGPGLGGAVVALGGVQAAFALGALSCLPMMATLRRWWREPSSAKPSGETLRSAIGGGLRFTFYSGALSRVVLRAALGSVGYIGLISLLPLGVTRWLDGGSEIYGLLLSCTGIGAFLGVMAGQPLSRKMGPEGVLRLTHVAMAIALIATPMSDNAILTGILMVLFGAGAALMMLVFNVNMQLTSPAWVVGRAISVFQMGAFGGLAIGALIWGTVADMIGLANSFYAAGVSLVVFAFGLGWISPLTRPDPSRLEVVDVPLESPDFGPGTDHLPVQISCEYEIAEGDEAEFEALMREWRTFRLSHGVRSWKLERDASNPRLWIETFVRPSASDLLRQLPRMTRREKEIVDAFKALHRGPDEPRPVYTLQDPEGRDG